MKSPHVKGIAAYEPGSGFPFPKGEVLAPVENASFFGAMKADEVPLKDFLELTKFPIVIYYGDFIPSAPSPQPHADYWRAAARLADAFAQAVNRHGGDARVVRLPEIGIKGNSHFPFRRKTTRRWQRR